MRTTTTTTMMITTMRTTLKSPVGLMPRTLGLDVSRLARR